MSEIVSSLGAKPKTTRILGLNFFAGSLSAACDRVAEGGLFTAPSGPGLAADLLREPAYRRALEASDVVLTDSTFLVLLWRLRAGTRLPRNSGLAFLRGWLNRSAMRQPGAVFWVMPSEKNRDLARSWLLTHGYPADPADFFVAPIYSAERIEDRELVARIMRRGPRAIYIGIGGGVQEPLGHYLKQTLPYRPAILCLGAAFAFVTGAQVRISPWVDRVGLGWLCRIASDPPRYLTRYARATRLGWLVLRFGADAPPLTARTPPERSA